MGLIGNGNSPPAPPSQEDPPPRDDEPDDTGIRVAPAGPIASRYGRKTSKAGRYAWAISLGIHAVVLAGAFVAMKYYFRPLPATKVSAEEGEQNGFGIIQSESAGALIQGGAGLQFRADTSAEESELFNYANLPGFVRRQPQTTLTLHDLSPISGVEGLAAVDGAGALPRHAAGHTIAP